MFFAGINFTLLYLLFLKGNFKRLLQKYRTPLVFGTVIFTLFTTVTLIFTSPFGIEESFP